MDIYHIWCSLKPGVKDTDFARHLDGYLGHLREAGAIEGWRLTRRKLGLGPADLATMGEFDADGAPPIKDDAMDQCLSFDSQVGP